MTQLLLQVRSTPWRRTVAALAISFLALVGGASPAQADFDGSQVNYTPCVTAWSTDGTPASARIGEHYHSITHYGNAVLLDFAHSTVDLTHCSPSQSRANVTRIWLTNRFDLYGSGMQCSTSISIPAGFTYSCTPTPTHVSFSFTRTCVKVSRCESVIGNTWIYAEPGQRFLDKAFMSTSITLENPGLPPYPYATHRF